MKRTGAKIVIFDRTNWSQWKVTRYIAVDGL